MTGIYHSKIDAFRGWEIGEGMTIRERDRLLKIRQAAQDAQAEREGRTPQRRVSE